MLAWLPAIAGAGLATASGAAETGDPLTLETGVRRIERDTVIAGPVSVRAGAGSRSRPERR